ncbi:MAG: nucleotidyltransferase domain-containing protein [Pseudomonadota bacterium]
MTAPTPYSQRARRAFLKYVESRFTPQEGIAFLGGSVAAGTARDGSDADGVVVLDNDGPAFGSRVKKVVDDIPLDIAIYNRKGLQRRFNHEFRSADPYVLNTIADGEVLTNRRSPAIRSLKRRARDMLDQGAPDLSRAQTRREQVEITELTERLAHAETGAEKRFLGTLLTPKLARFHLRQNNQWIGTHQKLLERLKRFAPAYAKTLDHALFDGLGQKSDPAPMIKIVHQTLAPVGGLTRRAPPVIDKVPTDTPPQESAPKSAANPPANPPRPQPGKG